MKRPPKPNVSPADLEAGFELNQALGQVSELPLDSQWEMALELMSDAFLLKVVRASQRKPEEMLNLLGLLSGVAVEALTGERGDADMLSVTLYGMIFSCLGELEKRYKHFSANVIQMTVPYDYDPEMPVLFIPKDPENFKLEDLFAYYRTNDPHNPPPALAGI